jgi:hypothetical protein
MKIKRMWLLDFALIFLVMTAGSSLYKLHVAGQPTAGLLLDAAAAGAIYSLFSHYLRKED